MKIAGSAIALLFWFCSFSVAQQYVASVKHYGPDNGLSHREVNAIFQDRQGFMWFGTKFGLNRFDGLKFTAYTKERNGLAFDDIQAIAQDADGLLWLMGPNGQTQITLFNPLTGQAISFGEKFKKHLPSVSYDIPLRLFGSDNGTIFFTSYQPAVLISYHPKSGLRYAPLPQFKTLTVEQVTARNTVWAIADNHILVELAADGHILHQFSHPKQVVRACFGQPNAGNELFYFVTGNPQSAGAFYSLDDLGNRREWPYSFLQAMPRFTAPICYAFDRNGLIWDGTHLRDVQKGVVLDVTGQTQGESITNRSFYRDRSGRFWLGTSFGIYQIRLTENHFRRLFFDPSNQGEKVAAVRGIRVIGDEVYANLEKFGLYKSSRWGGASQGLYEKSTFAAVYGLSPYHHGKLYAGARDQLFQVNLPTPTNRVIPLPGGLAIWTFHPLSETQLLAGGRPGLWVIQTRTDQVDPFTRYNQFTELAQSHVLHIGADRQGIRWICANTGLYTFDPAKGITARYWSGGTGRFYLPAESYQHFYQDSKGVYWLATANAGLIRWDRRQNQYRQFRRSEGLSNDNIYAVYPDGRGYLWMSSDYGIIQFDPVRFTTRAYFVEDGITHNEFNRIAHFQEPDGRIYFGGLNGITAFDPLDLQTQQSASELPLRITSFRQYDPAVDKLTDKTEAVVNSQTVTIQPDDRSGILDFALLNYANAEKNVFAYQFTGIDKDWTYQAEPSLRLSNLPYGEHQLRIKAQAANGQWSANTLALKVMVVRPFYLRPWFLVVMILLLTGGIWGWLRWRIWRHQVEQLRLETEIRQATARIEHDKEIIEQQAQALLRLDETKSRFFANISHEFRTPLTVILGMAAELKSDKPDQQPPAQAASLIERSGTNLLRLINQILDLSKLEDGQMHLHLVRTDLVGFTRYVAESLHTMAAIKDIQLHFQASEEALDADFDKDKLGDILSNLLTNALKFTPPGGRVSFQLTTHQHWCPLGEGYYEAISPAQHRDRPWISIGVSNTGPGIAPPDLPRIFDRFYQRSADAVAEQPVPETGGTGIGLSLVRELVALMQGGLAVRSQPGEETEFVIRLRHTQQAPVASTPVTESGNVYPDTLDENALTINGGEEKPVLLLVEDNEDVAAYIRLCIQTEYQIIRAENGQRGIELAFDKIPDLILSDVMMPLKDGFQLCDELKNDPRTSHIPIVLLTARAALNDRLSGLRRGADAYLTKPFQREELELVLTNLLQARHRLQLYYSQLALQLTSASPSPGETGDSLENQFLLLLRTTLETELANADFSIDELCQRIGMSRTTLHRKLVALTAMSVTHYIRVFRLGKAQGLLTTTNLNISEVAYAVGFDDPKYFSRVFSEEFGVSPINFRRSAQSEQ